MNCAWSDEVGGVSGVGMMKWLWVGMMMWVGGYDEVGGVSGVVK